MYFCDKIRMPLKIKSGSTGSLFSPLKKELHKHFEGIVELKVLRGIESPKSIEKIGKTQSFSQSK